MNFINENCGNFKKIIIKKLKIVISVNKFNFEIYIKVLPNYCFRY